MPIPTLLFPRHLPLDSNETTTRQNKRYEKRQTRPDEVPDHGNPTYFDRTEETKGDDKYGGRVMHEGVAEYPIFLNWFFADDGGASEELVVVSGVGVGFVCRGVMMMIVMHYFQEFVFRDEDGIFKCLVFVEFVNPFPAAWFVFDGFVAVSMINGCVVNMNVFSVMRSMEEDVYDLE
mmetsp:Transcript_2806/g.5191  ORF Transcript_2806/g.5191 Transcript_2806/m.5191 type:complete len:177 (-) Transcript_2806:685-1215(-)